MSGRASGGAVKRQREQEVEEEDAPASVQVAAHAEPLSLCASGQCATAEVPLQRAMDLVDCTSRAREAWVILLTRGGDAEDEERGFELASEGARLGCHHCQGVVAYCLRTGLGCEKDEALSLELARKSSGRGSKYGQHTLGELHQHGAGGLVQDHAQAVACYRLAAAQGLDGAQYSLGDMYFNAEGVGENIAEALRWYKLAAAQGFPTALYRVAFIFDVGWGVRKNTAEAIAFYTLAFQAGLLFAAARLRDLRA